MRVFMLGWEFPPHISGGLGTACYGMTKGLDEIGIQVCFVLPTAEPITTSPSHVKLRTSAGVARQAPGGAVEEEVTQAFRHAQLHRVSATLRPYASPGGRERWTEKMVEQKLLKLTQSGGAGEAVTSPSGEPIAALPTGSFARGPGAHYAGDLMTQVHRYARLSVEVARTEQFDVIHAHDWMTYPAGMAVSAATGKPLVVHVHSTEFDRAGEHVDQRVYDIERAGMHASDRVICVSYLTRGIVVHRYGVPPDKAEVVYNAVELPAEEESAFKPIKRDEKLVLFLGRVTMQKGPEYFLMAARKVIEKYKNVRFVMAGSGDMITRMINLAADLRIGGYVTFTGFLRGRDVDRVFQMADLYVMPSVSEPFGIAPLEALSHNVPVIISRQSGVSEVLTHVLKVDFWDIDEMANKILAVLRHPPLQRTLRHHGQIELQRLSWRDSAKCLREIYARAIASRGGPA